MNRAREARGSSQSIGLPGEGLLPTSRALIFLLQISWGSASLHPRLYAVATLRGLKQKSV